MERKSLSAVDISKKLIWEYLVASFIFGIVSYFIIGFSTKNMENAILKLIIQIVLSTITVFLYVWIGSRNIIQRYFIRKEDITVIVRNISIFFIVMIVIGFIMNYNSYQKFMRKEAKIYSITGGYNVNDIVDEAINRYESNGSYSDMYNNLKKKQEEKFKKEFSKKYGYILFAPTIYDIGLYGLMVFLQRKWLLNVQL